MEVRAIRRLLMEVRAVRDKSAGRVEDFPGPVVSRNAAVLEKLEKNGAFATRAGGAQKILGVDETREEDAAVLEKLEKNGAEKLE